MKIKSTFKLLIALVFFITLNFSGISQEKESENWLQWRGPLGTGAALKGNPPTSFSETKNLKWKTQIPGKGHATPIVWGKQIIIQTAVATDEKPEKIADDTRSEGERRMSGTVTDLIHEYKVISVNKETGEIMWERTVAKEMPLESTHDLGSWASNSPATDGELIYAYFGSRGIYCLDFDGNIKWQRDFGQMKKHMSFGEGSSPFLYKDKLFILWDHEGESILYALDKNTGKDIWKLERDERTSWSSPFVVEINGRTQVITSATTNIRSNDFETGELIWTSTGLTRNVIPNPIYEDGMLFVMSGFRGSALQAIDLGKAKGDITETDAIVWKYDENTPYTPNPVLMDGKLYFLRANNGYLTCLDAKDGKVNYSNQKLEGISTLFSSPTAVKDRLYIAAKNIVLVIKAGETFEVLESIELDDNFHSSPVIVGNDLILKGFNSLYCFSEE
ncbi:MAG: PQQ-like beta-propeller repeat protein [Prolixibacteraceae bacterium]|jgi:outer membrane protein assembly factor BamB|nr:PQQ-like beta-propeller repeat protein [Prolixibacteraceae bacterium]MBT6006364.1 PQQ-like beta-propeller repeat protein [Prolixibacteraceae bacterium]MBT6763368.1 PQQ-like beta-propeller repeat protein [Prolixibacteraceae bacterium]MBT6999980.1 PQQ-like beta-propeller repeat protein [Prolixibacteraceae bacterium]MBT7396548.1 PQQ-like beta-propeller repeat protein [Prolixibacteraceae bacterium]